MNNFYSFDENTIPYWIRALFWGLYMAVFVYAVWKMSSSAKNKQKAKVSGLFSVFFALYAVFYCINPDYFNYREWLDVISFDLWGKEKFYLLTVLLCQNLPFDYPYEVFRLIVWGGAVFIAYNTFRMYKDLILPGFTLLLLFVFHAGVFSYARASLAMAVYSFGIAFCLLHDKKTLKLLGLGIALSSFCFHHELLLGIAVLPCLFIPFERKSFSFLSIFMLIIVVFAISFVSSNLQIFDLLFDNDDISSKVEHFNNKEQGVFRVSTFVSYLKYFYPLCLLMISFWRKKAPRSIIGMYRITYGIMMMSIAFMVVFGLRSVYTYRTMYISIIPASLLISYGYNNGYFKKRQLIIMMIIVLLANSIRFINAH